MEGDPGSTNFRIEAAEAASSGISRGSLNILWKPAATRRPAWRDTGGAEQPRPILLYGMALMQMGQEDEARELLGEFIQLRRG